MIDIHAHILPGIDDGAEDIYDTLEMAAMAADSGVQAMIATPHCNIPGIFKNYYDEEYREIFLETRRIIEEERIPLELYPGMEVFGTYDLPKLICEEKVLTLNKSHYILIEFDFDEDPMFADRLLTKVCETKAKPVIAHVERYSFVQEDPQIIYEWCRKGYGIQVNKGSFLGRFGRSAWETAYTLLEHHLISAAASDAHGFVQRTPYMLDAYEELLREFPQEMVNLLFCENPRRICEDKPLQSLGTLLPF